MGGMLPQSQIRRTLGGAASVVRIVKILATDVFTGRRALGRRICEEFHRGPEAVSQERGEGGGYPVPPAPRIIGAPRHNTTPQRRNDKRKTETRNPPKKFTVRVRSRFILRSTRPDGWRGNRPYLTEPRKRVDRSIAVCGPPRSGIALARRERQQLGQGSIRASRTCQAVRFSAARFRSPARVSCHLEYENDRERGFTAWHGPDSHGDSPRILRTEGLR